MKTSLGTYGYRLEGFRNAGNRLIEVPPGWPQLNIEHRTPDGAPGEPPGAIEIFEDSATLWLAEGERIELTRKTRSVRFVMSTQPSMELFVHPLLALPAAVMSTWEGRLALHGGAFTCSDGAWAVIGDRGAGKSTSLAQLLELGHTVISDDMLIIDGRTLFSGPRSVDLRSEPAKMLGGEEMGILGARTRWRLRPGAAPAEIQLSGFILLDWGDDVAIEALSTKERLNVLYRNSAIYPGPQQSAALLELLVLPAWRFVRPRDLRRSATALAQLVAILEP